MTFLTLVIRLSLLMIGDVSSMIQQHKEWDPPSACYMYSSTSYRNESMLEKCSKAFRGALEVFGKRQNFTEDQISFVWSLEREMQAMYHKQRRVRRNVGAQHPYIIPVRRECRLLSHLERFHLFWAIRALKDSHIGSPPKSEYDTIGDLHKGMLIDAHNHSGSNFLGWHRVYILFYELALRRKRYGVSLCFWDTTFEYRLGSERWRDTSVFSSTFFGNRRGTVITGPFAYWPMPLYLQGMGPYLTRDVGRPGSGMPVDARATESIFYSPKTIRHTQVTPGGSDFETITDRFRNTRPIFIEIENNNVHNFVGRVMTMTDSSPQDPVFFFHHCFVDYMWERFREKMKYYGQDPTTDYPGHGHPELNRAKQPMIGFPGFKNIDGYSDFFTAYLYRYQTPTCFACQLSPYANCEAGECVATTIIPGKEITDGPWHPGTEPGSARVAAFDTDTAEAAAFSVEGGIHGTQTTMGRRFPVMSSTE